MSTTKPTICLIDDDETMLTLLECYLESDYNVVAFDNAVQALQWLKKNDDCDLVISDVRMPEMSGNELLDNIKGNVFLEHIPVFILSSLDKSQDRINCLKKGAEDFVIKPFNPEELAVKIEIFLTRKALSA